MKLLLECRAVARLLSESQDRAPPLVLRTRVRLHLLTCRGCRRLGDQMSFVRQAVQSMHPDHHA